MTTPAASSQPPPPPSTDSGALRIVLFGMPDAGKSSLLGALAQAAQTQERQLQGRLFDTTSGLAELQQRVYEDKPRETLQEIIPYPVRFEPLRGARPDPAARLDVVLYDCDGRAANEILTQHKSFDDARAAQLVVAIRRADALILVIDASNTDEQIDADFAEFVRFLHLLEEQRTRRADVAGLPVFLALTKCDLLARPGESAAVWNERIEARRRQLEQRFKEFLAETDEGPDGFGSLDVGIATTAVRRPAFHGAHAAREPFGVADLFRRAVLAAADYRQRMRSSHRRMVGVAVGAVAVLTLLIGGAVTLVLTRENIQSVALAGSVESYRSRENPTPSTRLTEPLQRKIGELMDIQRHPDFPRLSAEQRGYVEQRLKELIAYQEFKARLERERGPSEQHGPDELGRLETRLQESLGPPAEYQGEWAQTEAELLRQKWLEDARLMRRAATELAERYAGFTETATDLLQFKARPGSTLPWSEWHDRARELLAQAARQPYPENEPLRGSRSLPALKAPAVTYAAIHSFRTVEDARREWETVRGRLEQVRDLSLALGLAGDGSAETSPLKLPESFTTDQARTRLELLKKNYPRFAEWSATDLATAPAADVRSAAERSYQRLIEAGRLAVLAQLAQISPDGRETHERWQTVARWLPDAPELREWGQLVKVVQRLRGERAADPAATLAAFLQKPNHALSFNTVRVAIPDDVHDSRLRPTSNLTITHVLPGGPVQIQFRRLDESSRDNRNRRSTYTFVVEGNPSSLTFTPGDVVFAELSVRDENNKDWRLSWLQSRSEIYRFECLHRVPRFNPPGTANPVEGPLKDVNLSFTPEGGVPRVPDLMPVVILKR